MSSPTIRRDVFACHLSFEKTAYANGHISPLLFVDDSKVKQHTIFKRKLFQIVLLEHFRAETMMTDQRNNPGPYDVLCCKSSLAYDHVGNRRFRVLIECHKSTYESAGSNKMLKTQLVNSIIQSIKSAGGSFLVRADKEKGSSIHPMNATWEVMCMAKTKQKVGHALRRCVAQKFHTEKCKSNVSNATVAAEVSSKEEPIKPHKPNPLSFLSTSKNTKTTSMTNSTATSKQSKLHFSGKLDLNSFNEAEFEPFSLERLISESLDEPIHENITSDISESWIYQ